jgi:hypothetical protein
MQRVYLLLLCLFPFIPSTAQDSVPPRLNFGLEQDLLPYATGGYFFGAWAGKNHFRIRALTARVHKPEFAVKDGFTNNEVTAYALTADYFLKQNWKGWWMATGLVYWKSSIQTEAKTSTAYFTNWLLNGSIGYNFTLYRHLYLSPWAGLNLRVAGDEEVPVDGKVYIPPLWNPEASLKLGIYF